MNLTADVLTSSFQCEIKSRQLGMQVWTWGERIGLKDLGSSHSEVNAEAVRTDEITKELTYRGRTEDKHGGAKGGRTESERAPWKPPRVPGKCCAVTRALRINCYDVEFKVPQHQLAESFHLTGSRR